MIALRVVFRMGWALPNPATRIDKNRIGCPFAYLEPTSPIKTQKVTFTIKEGNEADAKAVEGARIDVNGAKLLTDTNGQVEFNLREGTYPVKITKKDYKTITDTVIVEKAAVTRDIVMIPNK